MKQVLSVSLGTPKRDKVSEMNLLGVPFRLERRGTNGDQRRFAEVFRELDGKVDAFGVGGADLWVVTQDRRYAFLEIQRLVSGAKVTPVVDGSGLKHTLERTAIRTLQAEGTIDFRGRSVLLVSAVDRFGMASALEEVGAKVVFGDLLFGLGIDRPLHSWAEVSRFGRVILPILTRLPLRWFYPTGEKQEVRTPKFAKYFDAADVILGDWHFIRRFAPNKMAGKTVVTQTLRRDDLDLLRSWGVVEAITTTPMIGGETFATNVMEAAIVALLERRPETLTEADYLAVLDRLGWVPNRIDLTIS